MLDNIQLDISGLEVFPIQEKLEDKIGYIARIERVYDTGRRGVRIGIQNKSDKLNMHSALTLDFEEFGKFLNEYNLKTQEYLIGKPVISVYDQGESLSGLIPINLDRE